MVKGMEGAAAFVQSYGDKALKTAVPEEEVQKQEKDEHKTIPAKDAEKMADGLNKFLEIAKTDVRFRFHEELEKYYVTIVNAKTEEVIKEIPSKKLMDIQAAMQDFVGMMVDRKI